VQSSAAARTPQPVSLPNFSGAWKSESCQNCGIINIKQAGNSVQIGEKTLTIRPDGSVGYQTFYATDQKHGHPVDSEEKADLVDTFSWSIDGNELVRRGIFDYRRPYFDSAVGKETHVMRFRRVDPNAPARSASLTASRPNFAGTWKSEADEKPNLLSINQTGNDVEFLGKTLSIGPDGTFGYATYYAADQNRGHAVESRAQADRMNIFNFRIEGDELVSRIMADTIHPYGGSPVGKVVREIRYRRIN
jgi:hypothetical protein